MKKSLNNLLFPLHSVYKLLIIFKIRKFICVQTNICRGIDDTTYSLVKSAEMKIRHILSRFVPISCNEFFLCGCSFDCADLTVSRTSSTGAGISEGELTTPL